MRRPGNLLLFATIIAATAAAQTDSTSTFKSGAAIIQVPVVVRDHARASWYAPKSPE